MKLLDDGFYHPEPSDIRAYINGKVQDEIGPASEEFADLYEPIKNVVGQEDTYFRIELSGTISEFDLLLKAANKLIKLGEEVIAEINKYINNNPEDPFNERLEMIIQAIDTHLSIPRDVARQTPVKVDLIRRINEN